MATTYIGPGETIQWTNSTSVGESSGAVIDINGTLGVLLVDIAAGQSGSVRIDGIFSLAKATGYAASVGDRLVWDLNAENFVAESASLNTGDVTGAVICVEAAASAATTVKVRLIPGVGSTAA